MTAQILRVEGIRGLYKGLSASYLGVSESTIQWVLYEQFKRTKILVRNRLGSKQSALQDQQNSLPLLLRIHTK